MVDNYSKLKISVITPVYSGANYLEALTCQLEFVRNDWTDKNTPFELSEVIFVDDAAIDNSSAILDALAKQYTWIEVIHLSRNYGQHPATVAGILYSSGDWIVTMDEDLQHPPAFIEMLLSKVAADGSDIVYANPQQSVHQNLIRDLGSRYYKKLIAKLTRNNNIPYFNSFRLIRGTIARAAGSVCSHDTYFDIALSWFTQRVGVAPAILKDERHIQSGKSGYSLSSLFSHARRMILSTHTKALRIAGFVGFITFFASIGFSLYIVFNVYFGWQPINAHGWSSLIVSILFIGSISILLSSVLLEYLSIILLHTQGKPTFFVVDRSNDKLLTQYFQENKLDYSSERNN